jgi:hypothetical protein
MSTTAMMYTPNRTMRFRLTSFPTHNRIRFLNVGALDTFMLENDVTFRTLATPCRPALHNGNWFTFSRHVTTKNDRKTRVTEKCDTEEAVTCFSIGLAQAAPIGSTNDSSCRFVGVAFARSRCGVRMAKRPSGQ